MYNCIPLAQTFTNKVYTKILLSVYLACEYLMRGT